jgi:PKD repeat protein
MKLNLTKKKMSAIALIFTIGVIAITFAVISPISSPEDINLDDSTTNTAKSATANYIGNWTFDGNGNNGVSGKPAATIGDGAYYVPTGGINNTGYLKCPNTNSYAMVSDDGSYDLPDTFTIEFWFRQYEDYSASVSLIYKGTSCDYNFQISRSLWDQYNHGTIKAAFSSTDTGGVCNNMVTNTQYNNASHGEWHYVAYVKGSTFHTYYIDGRLIYSTGESDQADQNDNAIFIGNGCNNTDFDEFKISSTPLTTQEIQTYYANHRPIAGFSATPQSIYTGNSIQFNSTTIANDVPLQYDWNFQDGVMLTNGPADIAHTYTMSGTYKVELNVTDQDGDSNQYYFTVYVSNPPAQPAPTVNFSMYVVEGYNVSFTELAYSTVGIMNFHWNFGDTNNYSGIDPNRTHVYATSGNYTVVLTITLTNGSTAFASKLLTLNPIVNTTTNTSSSSSSSGTLTNSSSTSTSSNTTSSLSNTGTESPFGSVPGYPLEIMLGVVILMVGISLFKFKPKKKSIR